MLQGLVLMLRVPAFFQIGLTEAGLCQGLIGGMNGTKTIDGAGVSRIEIGMMQSSQAAIGLLDLGYRGGRRQAQYGEMIDQHRAKVVGRPCFINIVPLKRFPKYIILCKRVVDSLFNPLKLPQR